jgi:UDP-N-acetyl-L-fucosamine synthase
MTIVGTRPELIRLSRVVARLDETTAHVLVHTGQNYSDELNGVFFRELGIRPPDVSFDAAGDTAAETIGNVIIAADRVLRERQPGALLILGDTNSSLAALPAKRLRIPVFHMEAGNRSFDQRVPEEINRRVVDHLADVNLPYTAIAREYLLREGLPPDRVIVTGSPMREVLEHYLPTIERSRVLARLGLEPERYFVVSCHREENVDPPEKLAALGRLLDWLARTHRKPIVFSTHPRTRARIASAGLTFDPLVQVLPAQGFIDYVQLQRHATAVLSDSGTITEESSILNFPALNLREAHERPEGMQEGAVMMTGFSPQRVGQALDVLATQERGARRTVQMPDDYQATRVSEKIVRIILSYTDYVRRTVWGIPGG